MTLHVPSYPIDVEHQYFGHDFCELTCEIYFDHDIYVKIFSWDVSRPLLGQPSSYVML